MEIREGGIEVYPGLVPDGEDREFSPSPLQFGIEELDDLVGGGLDQGARRSTAPDSTGG